MKKHRDLTDDETKVIVHKGTEAPFIGKYDNFYKKGTYHCKRCDARLYNSEDKFRSSCGWPSFDDGIDGSIKRKADADGIRVEMICSNCDAHLGHIFEGEGLTSKNVRHCVNSISLIFKPEHIDKAWFAGGCFWGVEHLFQKKAGVKSAVSGFMGGSVENPSYDDVVKGYTGHLEVVEVNYNPSIVSFEELSKFFFEIHDPTQANGQGPDIGEQYLSAIFHQNNDEKQIVDKLIGMLKDKGYDVVTKNLLKDVFWIAEEYHQDYYERKNQMPYCHRFQKRF
jgi:peptide methionine sulfoxide reductase msrA/msrB